MDTYITAKELRRIAELVEVCIPLWDSLTNSRDEVSIEAENFNLDVYDSNGEKLGIITWSESGPAFYPGTNNNTEG